MNVLIVAAHPDDEVLGCGGAIAGHVARGDRVEVMILGEGITSRGGAADAAEQLARLRAAAHKAADILGVAALTLHDLPDNRMDSVPRLEVVQQVEAAVASLQPKLVYTHFGRDVNVDHGVVYEAVVTACRPQPGHCVETLLCFETPSSTEWRPPMHGESFAPDWFVDIDASLAAKLQALAAYVGELRDWPHPRSLRAVETLARWRGAQVGLEAAEAFMLARHVVR